MKTVLASLLVVLLLGGSVYWASSVMAESGPVPEIYVEGRMIGEGFDPCNNPDHMALIQRVDGPDREPLPRSEWHNALKPGRYSVTYMARESAKPREYSLK